MGTLRTILRRLFYSAAAVSMLLLVAMLILWPVSYYRAIFEIYAGAGGFDYVIGARSGRLAAIRYSRQSLSPGLHFKVSDPPSDQWSYLSWNARNLSPGESPDVDSHTFLGARSERLPPRFGLAYNAVNIPFSYLALLFSILPLLAFRSIRRRRKEARDSRLGLCRVCGYNLLAHRIGQRCPECGTLIPPPRAAS